MRLLLLSAAGLAVFALLGWPLWTNQVVVDGDLGRAHLPSRYFYQNCLSHGDDFFWHPGQFCGYFIHGEGQGGYEHPWHRLLYSTIPVVPALNFEVFLNYPFMMVGMYLLLRRHQLGRDASLFGSLSFTFSGFNLPHYPHTNAIAIIAQIPWLIWATDILFRDDRPCRRVAAQLGITLLTASQVLLGYPQYLWFSALAEGLYVLVLLINEPKWSRLVVWIIAKFFGIVAGSAQLLPSLEALRDSPRMGYSPEFRGTFSLNPIQFVQLIAPTLFNEQMQLHEYSVYAGCLATLGLAWLLIRPTLKLPVIGQWAALLLLCSIPLALGRFTPLFHVYLRLPLVGVFRCPCRYLVLAHLASAVLTAIIVNRLSSPEPIAGLGRLWLMAIIPVLAWIFVFWSPHFSDANEMSKFVGPQTRPWLGALVLTAATILFALAVHQWRGALTLLMVLTIADLGYFGLKSIWVYRTGNLATYRALEPQPPGPPHGRVEIVEEQGNALNVLDWPLTNGYVGLTPPRMLDYHHDEVLRVAGTVWKFADGSWRRLDGIPRLRIVGTAQHTTKPADDLCKIDPMNTVLVDRWLALDEKVTCNPSIIEDRPGRVVVQISARQRGVLVFTESFHEAWRATIDERPAELMRAYGDFMACAFEPGNHQIAFRFAPSSVILGRRLSWGGLAAAFVFAGFLIGLWRRRRD